MKLFKRLVLLSTLTMSFGQTFAQEVDQNLLIKVPSEAEISDIESRLMSGSGFGPGNGGNEFLFEVDSMLKEIITIINFNSSLFPELTSEDLKRAVQATAVLFVDKLPNSTSRYAQALNWDQEKLILISLADWNSLGELDKRKLIFHEFLGIMGLERENAIISNRLTDLIGNQYRTDLEFDISKHWFFSTENDENFILNFSQYDEQSGSLTLPYGHTKVKWSVIGNKASIIPISKKPVLRISYPMVATPTGREALVDQTSQLLNFEILKFNNSYKAISYWKSCYKLDRIDTLSNKETTICYLDKIESNNLIGLDEINPIKMNLSIGDSFVVPTVSAKDAYSYNSILIKKNKFGIEEFKSLGLQKFNIKDFKNHSTGEISYSDKSETRYKLSIVKDLRGFYKAILIAKTKQNTRVMIVPFMQIKESLLPNFTRENAIGEFLHIYHSTTHTKESWLTIFFDPDGVGGKAETSNIDHVTNYQYWQWEIAKGEIHVKELRKRTSDLLNSFIADNRDEVKSCTMETCWSLFERTYKLLKVRGNRYFTLRTMVARHPDTNEIQHQQSVLQIFDKY